MNKAAHALKAIILTTTFALLLSPLVIALKTERGIEDMIKGEPMLGTQSNVSCPESIVLGVINPPAGWTDYDAKRIHFTGSSIKNTAQGAQITCDYGIGAALNRFVPGRACERLSSKGPHMSCKAIPTKK